MANTVKNLSLIEDRTLANFQNWTSRHAASLKITNAGHATVATVGGLGRPTATTPWMVMMGVACGGAGGGLGSYEGLL